MKHVDVDGVESWTCDKKGHFHREDGPAILYADGSCSWWLNGKRHRVDGPARTFIENGGDPKYEWWIDNEFLFVSSQEDFEKTPQYKRFKLIAFS